MSKPKSTTNPPTPAVQKLIYRILLAGGLMLLALGVTLLIPGLKTRSWPTATGIIIGHRVESVYSFKRSRPAVAVRYSYEVDGTRYRSETFSNSSKTLTAPAANPEEAVKAYRTDPAFSGYQKGKSVPVYYDPADPGNAVLKRGIGYIEVGLLLLGIFLVGSALSERRHVNKLEAAKSVPSTP